MKKIRKSNLILIALTCLTVLCLLNSTIVTNKILVYTKLFIEKLFPASFLFFTLSTLLIEYNMVQKLSKVLKRNSANLYIIVMSLISGFPSGSKYTKELLDKNLITEESANKIISYVHFPNPIFILGPVAALFPSKKYTVTILLSIIIANGIIALINHPKEKGKITITQKEPTSFAITLSKACYSSIKTLLLIYGTSIFFYLIITLINHYIKFSLPAYVFFNGLFDLTNGIFLTSLITNPTIRGLFIIFFTSFGGLSVHMQTKSIIADTSINYNNFLLGRCCQTVLASIIFTLLI